jgi:hypothetical protein
MLAHVHVMTPKPAPDSGAAGAAATDRGRPNHAKCMTTAHPLVSETRHPTNGDEDF